MSQPSQKETFLGHAPVDHKMGKCDGKVLKEDDALTKYQNISWEGRQLNVKGPNRDHKLIKEPIIYSPVGDGYKLGRDPHNDQEMFFFARNKASLDCCSQSPYSSDLGCICQTKDQVDMISNRGGNLGGKDNEQLI